jgi:hypothetical protein
LPQFHERFNRWKKIGVFLSTGAIILAVMAATKFEDDRLVIGAAITCFALSILSFFGMAMVSLRVRCPKCANRLNMNRQSGDHEKDEDGNMIVRCPNCESEWNLGVKECPE